MGSPSPTSAVGGVSTGTINNPTAASYGVQVTAVGTSVGTLPSQTQTFKSTLTGSAYSMDPMPSATAPPPTTAPPSVPSPISLYAGVLPAQSSDVPDDVDGSEPEHDDSCRRIT